MKRRDYAFDAAILDEIEEYGSSLYRIPAAAKPPKSMIHRNSLFIHHDPAPVKHFTRKEIKHAYR